ncbi:MAG TPA: hypothetical protein H9671_02440 [Firmicutes bacterium]|nr:hypothetical protein [Bacillota bacterium]
MNLYSKLTALRMQRMHFAEPSDTASYDTLFRMFSPVPPVYWTAPGQPPSIPAHTAFDDLLYNSIRRQKRDILKGRFGGNLGYVAKEDWELFCCLYRKEISLFSERQLYILQLLEREGPMNIRYIKDLTGMLVKEITPVLHQLQEACLVYEDQLDAGGDRGWYCFANEFPEVNLHKMTRLEALQIVICRFATATVFFSADMLKSFYRLPQKDILTALSALVQKGLLLQYQIGETSGYITPQDRMLLENLETEKFSMQDIPAILLLQKNDFWVRANEYWLKKQFSSAWDPLYYLLIDGVFHGMVAGKFKFGPHIVEDIILDFPEPELTQKRSAILQAVAMVFPPNESPVQRYCGKPL